MTFNEFHNALRILCWNIERREVPWMTNEQWSWFNRDTVKWFVSAPDADAHRIFAIIEARQPKRDKPGDDVDDLINEVLLHVDDDPDHMMDAAEKMTDDPDPPYDEGAAYDEAQAAEAAESFAKLRDMMDAGRGHLVRK